MVRAAKLASLGLEMGVAVAIGWGVGAWLDRRLGTKPWLMLVFLLFGVAAGFKGMIQATREAMRAAAESSNDEDGRQEQQGTEPVEPGPDGAQDGRDRLP